MSDQSPFSIADVLALPAVRRAEPELLAGADRLEKEVRWVHAGEVPNMATLLKGGELLLSTGMGIGRTPILQRRFVTELAEIGIAALAIELGTSLTEMPEPLVKAAEEEGLCLIAFHREVRFIEITEGVHRELVDRGGNLLRRGDEMHRRFTALMLGGAGVPEVLDELADFVDNPIVLERAGGGVAYHARHRSDDATVLGAWGSLIRGPAASPAAVFERVPMGPEGTWGRLIALSVESPIEAQDLIAVERAVGLIALALMRTQEEEVLATRRHGDFLAGLTRTRAGEREIRARAAELGFASPEGGTLLPLAVAPAPTAERRRSAWQAVRRDLQEELTRQDVPTLVGSDEVDRTLIIVGMRRVQDRARVVDLLVEQLDLAVSRRLDPLEAPTVCVGAASPSWLGAGDWLAAATDALLASSHMERKPWHDISVASTDRLLFTLRDRAELREFTDLRLRALKEEDRTGRGNLVETLAAFCANAGRRTETAKALHIERQTLYHRLKRIEATVGDLTDGEALLSLHLALRADRYLAIP
jgi:purine catabolism regulator